MGKFRNYEALFIHEKGNRTSFSCDFAAEALDRFRKSPTSVKMILFKSTHNNTRLKKYAEYGSEFKQENQTIMNIEQIKKTVLISEFLNKEGHKPDHRSGQELFYRSPLRNDMDPSFTVNDSKGVWFDHGTGRGGSVIDLAMELHNTDLKGAIRILNGLDNLELSNKPAYMAPIESKKHEIVSIKPLGHNFAITAYLQERGIYEEAIKSGKVQEIYYDHINEAGERKRYFGAGWQNESGGYEVRSKYGKMCLESKDILVLKGGQNHNVFEGMINFLSALKEKQVSLADTNVILNSTALVKKGIAFLNRNTAEKINLFFDNDKGGRNCTQLFLDSFPESNDKSLLYSNYTDYNDKLMSENPSQKKSLSR